MNMPAKFPSVFESYLHIQYKVKSAENDNNQSKEGKLTRLKLLTSILKNWDVKAPQRVSIIPFRLLPHPDYTQWGIDLLTALSELSSLTINDMPRAHALLQTYNSERSRKDSATYSLYPFLHIGDILSAIESVRRMDKCKSALAQNSISGTTPTRSTFKVSTSRVTPAEREWSLRKRKVVSESIDRPVRKPQRSNSDATSEHSRTCLIAEHPRHNEFIGDQVKRLKDNRC